MDKCFSYRFADSRDGVTCLKNSSVHVGGIFTRKLPSGRVVYVGDLVPFRYLLSRKGIRGAARNSRIEFHSHFANCLFMNYSRKCVTTKTFCFIPGNKTLAVAMTRYDTTKKEVIAFVYFSNIYLRVCKEYRDPKNQINFVTIFKSCLQIDP